MQEIAVFWFRRDLRLSDNAGLHHALKGDYPVLPIFIFDKEILDHLPKKDARVSFIHKQLRLMNEVLKKKHHSGLFTHYGTPASAFEELNKKFEIKTVHTNRDYEPYAKERDAHIGKWCKDHEVTFKDYKDQVIFEKSEVVKDDGTPYVVYTPYKNKWLQGLKEGVDIDGYDLNFEGFLKYSAQDIIPLKEMGFTTSEIEVPDYSVDIELIENYEQTRNYPAKENGTSRLGPHLRFGTISIRRMVQKAIKAEEKTFLSELIWREFFMQILWHFPHTGNQAFKAKYDRIEWRNNEHEFEKWKKGQTGYHLVDAGMRELNQTGYMHNRVRMLVASFLCKHLLIDWRWGEAYFAEKLLDYEMASNVGNWQWAAGSGVDAAPYFRIFNPMTQIKKFDKQEKYIRRWVPEFEQEIYPEPIVEHKKARERCLETYKEALS